MALLNVSFDARCERWVVAPHPDDELLGLGAMFRDRSVAHVVYPSRSPENALRREEAAAFCKYAQCLPHFDLMALVDAPRGAQVFVPSPNDRHPEHQQTLSDVATILVTRPDFEVREYAVGGGQPYTETVTDAVFAWKHLTFECYYPSQRAVLIDPSFFLFEGHALLGVPSITVTFEMEGFHAWAEAPREVAYLANVHRHMFGVRLTLLGLYREDREQEFHLVKRWAEKHFKDMVGGSSCEVMARRLAMAGRARYAVPCEVEVWEDGECGAKVRV